MCPRSENVNTGIWIWFQILFSFHGQNNPSPCPSRSIMCVNEALKLGSSLPPVDHLISLPQLLDSSKIEKGPWRYFLLSVDRRQDQRQSTSTTGMDVASPGESPQPFPERSNFSLVFCSQGLFEQRLSAITLLKTCQVTWLSCSDALLAFSQNWWQGQWKYILKSK